MTEPEDCATIEILENLFQSFVWQNFDARVVVRILRRTFDVSI